MKKRCYLREESTLRSFHKHQWLLDAKILYASASISVLECLNVCIICTLASYYALFDRLQMVLSRTYSELRPLTF